MVMMFSTTKVKKIFSLTTVTNKIVIMKKNAKKENFPPKKHSQKILEKFAKTS